MKKVAFLINRIVKRYHFIVKQIEDNFITSFDSKIFVSEYGGHIIKLANEAHQQGYDYIITVGGDGTINEALNGILSRFKRGNEFGPESYDWNSVKSVKLGLFPAGTGNDFARYHGLKKDIDHLKSLIEKDSTTELDIGWCQFTDLDRQPTERFFINITDVGAGGHTVEHMANHRVKWLSSNMNYMKAIMSSFITYDKSKVKWSTADRSWEGKVMSMIVANGKYFGSGLGIAPDAKMDDGLFSLVTLGDISILDYAMNLGTVKKSRHMKHKEVTYDVVSRVTIEPTEGQELPIDMDGDFVGYCPMTLQCIKQAVTFLV